MEPVETATKGETERDVIDLIASDEKPKHNLFKKKFQNTKLTPVDLVVSSEGEVFDQPISTSKRKRVQLSSTLNKTSTTNDYYPFRSQKLTGDLLENHIKEGKHREYIATLPTKQFKRKASSQKLTNNSIQDDSSSSESSAPNKRVAVTRPPLPVPIGPLWTRVSRGGTANSSNSSSHSNDNSYRSHHAPSASDTGNSSSYRPYVDALVLSVADPQSERPSPLSFNLSSLQRQAQEGRESANNSSSTRNAQDRQSGDVVENDSAAPRTSTVASVPSIAPLASSVVEAEIQPELVPVLGHAVNGGQVVVGVKTEGILLHSEVTLSHDQVLDFYQSVMGGSDSENDVE